MTVSSSRATVTRRLPGVEGVWVFVLADMCFFGLLLSMMVLSGLLIWTKRTALATANALKRSNKRPRDEAATASSAGTTEISQ